MQPAIYILASQRDGTLYVGVTSDLIKRVWEHKNHAVPGFTRDHYITDLVYFEMGDSMVGAIEREKQLKKWNRRWKIELIEETNPTWRDLYPELVSGRPEQDGSPRPRG